MGFIGFDAHIPSTSSLWFPGLARKKSEKPRGKSVSSDHLLHLPGHGWWSWSTDTDTKDQSLWFWSFWRYIYIYNYVYIYMHSYIMLYICILYIYIYIFISRPPISLTNMKIQSRVEWGQRHIEVVWAVQVTTCWATGPSPLKPVSAKIWLYNHG